MSNSRNSSSSSSSSSSRIRSSSGVVVVARFERDSLDVTDVGYLCVMALDEIVDLGCA